MFKNRDSINHYLSPSYWNKLLRRKEWHFLKKLDWHSWLALPGQGLIGTDRGGWHSLVIRMAPPPCRSVVLVLIGRARAGRFALCRLRPMGA